MKALSIRSPWWWFILHGGKDIENRDWPTRFRGRVLIHASKWWNNGEIFDDWTEAGTICEWAIASNWEKFIREVSPLRGHIVGSIDIVDCISRSDSPWFFGRYGFVLRNPVAFERPIPYRGALGFFDAPIQPGARPDTNNQRRRDRHPVYVLAWADRWKGNGSDPLDAAARSAGGIMTRALNEDKEGAG